MAKYKKKSSNIETIVITILLIMAIVAGVLCCGYAARTDEGWFKNSDFSTWHWNEPAPDKEPETPENEAANAARAMLTSESPNLAAQSPSYFNFDRWLTDYGEDTFLNDYGEEYEMFSFNSLLIVFINETDDIGINVSMRCFYEPIEDYYNVFILFDTKDTTIQTWNLKYGTCGEDINCSRQEMLDPYMYVLSFGPSKDLSSRDYYLYVTQNIVLELPEEPQKEGYTFVGWYLDEALTIPYKGEPITADMTFYAKFVPNQITVTFDLNGGTGSGGKSIVNWGTTLENILETPVKTGYNFLGWFLPNGTQYTNQTIKEDITITAHWQIKVFTVTFKVEGEIFKTMEVDYGTSLIKIIHTADLQNLEVLSVSSESGKLIEDYTAVSVSENYSLEVREMQGAEKAANIFKNYFWYIFGGAAGVLSLCCIIGAVIKIKRNG